MKRRTFIVDTGSAMLCGAMLPIVLARAITDAAPRTPSALHQLALAHVAVYDRSFDDGRRLAREAARLRVPAFALDTDTDADIGALWHMQIAGCVARDATLAVALRPADRFVLARLGAPLDCRLIDV